MANTSSIRGLKYVGNLRGTPLPMIHMYYKSSSIGAMYVGDPVKSDGTADTSGEYAGVDLAAAGDAIRGVVMGFVPVWGTPSVNYAAASTAGYVLVCDDPDAIFEIQEDGVGGQIAITAIGNNADIVVAAGSAVTGYAGTLLDSSDVKTATAQLRILSIVPRPDNALGAYAKFRVLINEHELKSTTGA